MFVQFSRLGARKFIFMHTQPLVGATSIRLLSLGALNAHTHTHTYTCVTSHHGFVCTQSVSVCDFIAS